MRKDGTYLFSVGDSDLDQLKTPSTMEMLCGAGKKKKRHLILVFVQSPHQSKWTESTEGGTHSSPLVYAPHCPPAAPRETETLGASSGKHWPEGRKRGGRSWEEDWRRTTQSVARIRGEMFIFSRITSSDSSMQPRGQTIKPHIKLTKQKYMMLCSVGPS